MDKITYYKRNGEERSEAHRDAIKLLDEMCGKFLKRYEDCEYVDPFERQMLSSTIDALRMVSVMD